MYLFSNERLDKLDQQTQLLKGDTILNVAIVARDTNFFFSFSHYRKVFSLRKSS